MSERRLFTVNTSDWGQTHLTSDAVVAFVDDELALRPHARATQHVAACPDCASEVVAQRQARTALRGASCPSLPSSLFASLRAIPQDADLPDLSTGLAVSSEGRLVTVVETEPEPAPAHGPRPGRRLRRGAGVAAASGIAIGALAFGTAALPSAIPTADRGVLGGSVLGSSGVAPARLGLDAPAAADDTRLSGLRAPRTFLRHGLH